MGEDESGEGMHTCVNHLSAIQHGKLAHLNKS